LNWFTKSGEFTRDLKTKPNIIPINDTTALIIIKVYSTVLFIICLLEFVKYYYLNDIYNIQPLLSFLFSSSASCTAFVCFLCCSILFSLFFLRSIVALGLTFLGFFSFLVTPDVT